jgi:hypothetical protein
MARCIGKPFSITALAFAAALCPPLAGAQSTFPAGVPSGAERRPSLLVSVAASPVGLDDWRRSDGPALVGSVQGRLKRFLVLEGEVTRWTAVDDFGFPGYFGEESPVITSSTVIAKCGRLGVICCSALAHPE